jgi:hypothetical protein
MAKTKVGWDTGQMPEKMIAMAKFHGSLLRDLQNDPKTYNMIASAGAKIISKYFDAYVDHVARIDSYRYHHIYEFGMTGNSSGRLFKSSIKNGNISYSLIDAKVPNKDGYSFSKKAFVMEAGEPITITPKNGEFLVYDLNGEMIVSRGSFVPSPGGTFVKGSFADIFNEFFNSNLPEKALREFKFYDTIEKALESETKKMENSVSNGDIKNSASKAAEAAYGIARKVEDNANRL